MKTLGGSPPRTAWLLEVVKVGLALRPHHLVLLTTLIKLSNLKQLIIITTYGASIHVSLLPGNRDIKHQNLINHSRHHNLHGCYFYSLIFCYFYPNIIIPSELRTLQSRRTNKIHLGIVRFLSDLKFMWHCGAVISIQQIFVDKITLGSSSLNIIDRAGHLGNSVFLLLVS